MAGAVQVFAGEKADTEEVFLESLNTLASGTNVASGAAKIASGGGEAIVGREGDRASSKDVGLLSPFARKNGPADGGVPDVKGENKSTHC